MTLDASGRLLLGTTTAPSGGSATQVISASNGGLQLHSTSQVGGALLSSAVASGGLGFYTYTGNVGSETYAERARIDSNGNLFIGATSTAFPTQGYKLNVQSGGSQTFIAIAKSGQTLGSGGMLLGIDATGGAIYVNENAPLDFYTNATQRARIDSSGNLLVGTTSATGARLTVASTVNTQSEILQLNASSGDVYGKQIVISQNKSDTTSRYLSCETNNGNTAKLYIYSNGNVVNANNSYGSLSDAKLKENIVDASPKLTGLMQVKVRNYNLIGDTTKQIGVVAQELETVFPSMIDISPDIDKEGNDLGTTTKSVKYSVFVPMLIKALQEQQAIIVSLQARLDAANL
jgi:hypothetical protein